MCYFLVLGIKSDRTLRVIQISETEKRAVHVGRLVQHQYKKIAIISASSIKTLKKD